MSIIHPNKIRLVVLTFILCAVAIAGSLMAKPPTPTILWKDGANRGQWKPFGQGMQDSVALPEGSGLRLIVDWKQTNYGVGALFAADPKAVEAVKVPNLSGFHKLQFEARRESQSNVQMTVELVVQQTNRETKAASGAAKPLNDTWQKYEFTLPDDFPGLDADSISKVDAIKLLFSNAEKSGKDTLEFRNVSLVP